MADAIETAPSLPPGPVDFGALCAAIESGKTADEAIAAATPAEPAVETPQQPVEPLAVKPAAKSATSEKEG